MKIWIDTSFALNKKTGIGAYLLTVMNAMDKLVIYYEKISCNFLENKPLKAIPYFIWLNTTFFIRTLINKPNTIIFPSFMMPYFKRKNTRYLTTIHDLTPYIPETMGKYATFINKFAIKNAVKKADTILTVSETVKKELIKKFSLPEEKVKVTYNSLNLKYLSKKNFEYKKELPKNYILSVATLNKRKNLISLIKAFESISSNYPEMKLVLVGMLGNDKINELTTNENIIFTGYVSDEELISLYRKASIYVFPSIYEGFGIPILEAQASKVPVICSNIDVFKEIAKDSAVYCEPTPEGIAEKIVELINNKELQENLIEKGLKNLNRFNLEVIENQIKDILELA